MKFIHTSDWHIGRQFHNVSLLEDQKHVLNQLIEYIKSEDVDALVIAGDIYDRSLPPANAVELLDDVLKSICMDLNIPIILIPGNHDSAERVRFGAKQMKESGLHIIGSLNDISDPVVIKIKDLEVAFYGIPYCEPLTVRDTFDGEVKSFDDAHTFLVDEIKSVMSDEQVNVLISHCFIDGASESDSERPLQIGGADRVSFEPCLDFDYVALGHLHSPQYKGAEHIRYSGSIMKYSFSEQNQKKGVTLVEVNSNGLVSQTHLPLKPLRDMRVVEDELETIIEQGKVDPNADDYLLVRLTDKHAILDPMGKLRAVYPNVLHLEKPGMFEVSSTELKQKSLKQSELDMFKDFYSQIAGQEMSEEQNKLVSELINGLTK
ncbi:MULTISPECIES: exonuclease SbcCD subunit D [Pseudoalteromonas]|uniref:exonuclease SbcCD subunit D n=1 Tax=Pseudoalteromonas TaxID=53246 RepID=UPI001F35F2C9|nr:MULTISPECIES: exonuclease SbcCD subunit D [Pseudoalteromonas]MCF2918574.1 exonuclease SbcCD subunit D [Pseudoalteromonas sp. Cn5-37]MCZ4253767.1 exonuclease SbcCD subunit D [Pseudoalteromonas shioyasakiensis]